MRVRAAESTRSGPFGGHNDSHSSSLDQTGLDTAPVSGRSHVNLPLASDANAHFYASTHMTPLHRPTARTPPAPHVIHRVFRISHGSHMPC